MSFITAQSQTWTDSMDIYVRTKYMPPLKNQWSWQRAALLKAITEQYNNTNENDKKLYLNYMIRAVKKVKGAANGRTPNAVASGLGVAFVARVTGDATYKSIAEKVFEQYQKINRTSNGGVSHLANYKELWDDTIFMVGIFLQEMYLLTNDEKYIDELVFQIDAHREKLLDPKFGLWYHGWDDDDKGRCNICGEAGWSKDPEHRSQEFWGRGNGWVVVTLSQTINVLPKSHPKREKLASYLKEMVVNLPQLQDTATGHWFQLPIRTTDPKNYIESSCTAMFAYGISSALKLGIVSSNEYQKCVDRAYIGLRKHSIQKTNKNFLTTKNVCKGTCIGSKDYYLNRRAKSQKPFGLGMFILFGRSYEKR